MLCGGDCMREANRMNALNDAGGIGDLITGCWLVYHPTTECFFHPANPTNVEGTDH
jgi:hypothetical protein